jgi:tRNA-dihydrouridine synthase B
LRQHINTIEDCGVQWQAVADYLEQLATQMDRLPVAAASDPAPLLEESAGQTA